MNTNTKIIIAVLVVAILGGVIYYKTKKVPLEAPQVIQEESIKGCYVATLAKDVYTLNILSQEGVSFKGTLSFKNFEKDSSSGTYEGAYQEGILLGDYLFQSEGTYSVMQVIFQKSGNTFIRGYGDSDSIGTRFADLNNISYDNSQTFVASPCI